MPILFAANRLTDYSESDGTETTASGFDSAYVPLGVRPRAFSSGFAAIVAPSSTFWVHFREVILSGTSSASGSAVVVTDSLGVTLFTLSKTTLTANTLSPVVLGTANVTGITIGRPTTANTVTTWDFKIVVSGTTTTVEIYINGALNQTITNAGNGGRSAASTVRVYPAALGYDQHAVITLSEFIVSTTSTVGQRLAMILPASAGADTTMTGTYTSLADSDPTSGVTATADSQRFSWNPTAYGGAAKNLAAVVLKGVASRGITSVKTLAQYLKISGVNYDGAALAVGENTPLQEVFELNPATSGVWTSAQLSGLQAGVKT